ncbi:serine/threonine protein kinase [Deinococcus humi]|uniref:Serine/threonine-protein kinase n=1 Tax=Deinococcus humi TaxID=662880 RepID=A0A7W8NC64_9DEIO|nr:serine/threonine-protein kinase [Deinococcus humi]MBB5360991.1 serine/threonine-protein kinase [Deinococcus humi]GGO17971.1 serine/threonine protein kinase [Deinococcus humi]
MIPGQSIRTILLTFGKHLTYSGTVQELTIFQELESRTPLAERAGVLSESAQWRGLPVFVKTLMVDDPDAQARFHHEGRVAASLNHPGIVPLLAVSPRQLIFPFVEGGTLRERLECGVLDVQEATEVVMGLLHAVVYLHRQGVTHQDLKPENVLLQSGRAGQDTVRIIDFGMSHARHMPLDIHSGTRMGTPHFMAPEQFYGMRGDIRSDLYSVGVLLFDCLAGGPPYADALGWLAGIHTDRAELPGPAALHPLLRSALSRDPAQRPHSAGAMLRLLCLARQELGLSDLENPGPADRATPDGEDLVLPGTAKGSSKP